MDEQKILDVIVHNCEFKADQKYLPCAKAVRIAEELNVNVATIGRLCNLENIKVKNCQLGCF